MSHLTLESPSDSQLPQSPSDSLDVQDSPTIDRAAVDFPSADNTTLPAHVIPTTQGTRSQQRKPTPSPLQTSTAVSPPSSASPNRSKFPSPVYQSFPAASVSQISIEPSRPSPTLRDNQKNYLFAERGYRREEISPPVTPVLSNTGSSLKSLPSPNDIRSVSDPVAATKPVGSPTAANLPSMAGGSASSGADVVNGAPRTSSIDSAMSAISSRTHSQQGSQDANADVANLVRAAGSPEAVIQYLLKEKNSQAQQNAQLWRLVDKQRAMILGLNKDLERALKDKEKYRKKLKDVVAVHDGHAKRETIRASTFPLPRVDVNLPKDQEVDIPASPSNLDLDSDSIKHSPIDMSLAPYPITPPADQLAHGPPSAVGELLDPSHAMPKPSEHALDHFDREEQDRAIEDAKKASEPSTDIPIHLALPLSRSLPSEPPRVPAPNPPTTHAPAVSVIEATPLVDSGIAQFPPPSAPPPRKPPPAPLQLKKDQKVATSMPPEEDNDSSSDYDSLLEVDELPIPEKRGRRRTREEDDRNREIIALKEAETRSLSKKSKKDSQKGSPTTHESQPPEKQATESSQRASPPPMVTRETIPASLDGVLSGNEMKSSMLTAPLKSPGLPASPRPMGMKSPFNSPPLSPRTVGPAGQLSPRAPRQPIPLPPNTPLSHPSSAEPLNLASSKPPNVARQAAEADDPGSPASSESPVERTKVYKGFVTDEFPDLLLPPNALPSIVVRVASSRMKPSRASLLSLTQLEEDPVFTLAITSRSQGVELWRVEKDSASLGKLDQRMKQCASFTAKTPDRALFSGHSPAKLDARRTVLDQYFDELLNTPLDLQTALELCNYLSSNTLRPNAEEPASSAETKSEAGAQKTSPGGKPLKSGYLTKRGKNFGGWKARFFVLEGPHLKYYETPGGAHLGTIKLQHAQIGKQQSHQTGDDSPARGPNGDELDNQYRHAFLVLEPKKKDSSSHVKHVLCAESDEERDQWVNTLLRFIGHRTSSAEKPHASSAHERRGGGDAAHANGASSKKKTSGHDKSQAPRSNSQDGLIGMSYDSAKQGHIPEGAPPRRRTTASPEPQDKVAASAHAISGPKDAHLISDSASWGGKASLVPPGPTMEEKKQRKRSFFGFGPKTRPSSDDQGPLYGSSGGNAPQGQSEPRGPIRQVFGAPLAEAVRYNGPFDVSVPLPAVIYRCIKYLDVKNAILEEGIFRLSGSNVVIKQLRERFNVEGDINLLTDETYYDIHAVASLLKLYLRELPATILTRDLHMRFVAVTEMPNHREKIPALSELVQRLPIANETLLKYLIAFLIKIINHSDINKMTVRNVGIVFSPTLNIPAPVFALLLQNYEAVFGHTAEEYELPSPVFDADSRPLAEPQPRPPSAATGGSPHRQRLMEQVQQRSSPTPPPGMTAGGLRPTPTPPLRQTYEPQYLAQQGAGSYAPPPRPAYEGGLVPPGYDPSMMQAPVSKQPTYDRPHYGSPYEQDFNGSNQSFDTRSKRRQSSMFMGNMLNNQGSNSRLREENRM